VRWRQRPEGHGKLSSASEPRPPPSLAPRAANTISRPGSYIAPAEIAFGDRAAGGLRPKATAAARLSFRARPPPSLAPQAATPT
jgi:hypothetical protein